jgi:hypothetical protein
MTLIHKHITRFAFSMGVLLVSSVAWSQEKEITLEEFSAFITSMDAKIPQKTSYSIQAEYFFFDQLQTKDTAAKMAFSMVYNHSKKLLNMQQMDKFVVQDEQFQVIIDTVEKTVLLNVSNPDLIGKRTSDDFKDLLKSKCKATVKKGKTMDTYYLMFPPGTRYLGVELWVDKKDQVRKYIMYAGKEIVDESAEIEKLIQPRMEIHYAPYVIGGDAEKQKLIQIKDIVQLENPMVLLGKYAGFELIDMRIKN